MLAVCLCDYLLYLHNPNKIIRHSMSSPNAMSPNTMSAAVTAMFPTAIARCNLTRDSDSEDDTKDKGDVKEKGAWIFPYTKQLLSAAKEEGAKEEGAKEEGAKQLVAAPPAVSPEDAQKMTGPKRACFASNRPAWKHAYWRTLWTPAAQNLAGERMKRVPCRGARLSEAECTPTQALPQSRTMGTQVTPLEGG